MRLWDAATGAAVATLEGHTARSSRSPSRPTASACSPAPTIRPRGSGTRPRAPRRDTRGPHCLCQRSRLLARRPRVLTGSDDKTVRLWDAATGAAVATLEGHTASVVAVAFSPDGKRILTGSETRRQGSGTRPPAPRRDARGTYRSSVHAVAFSPDGKRVLTGSDDKTVRLWDAATAPRSRRSRDILALSTRSPSRPTASAFFPAPRQDGKALGRGHGPRSRRSRGIQRCRLGRLLARRPARRHRLLGQDGTALGRGDRRRGRTLEGIRSLSSPSPSRPTASASFLAPPTKR